MGKAEMPKTDTIQSVALAMHVLETLAGSRSDMGVTALADALGMTKSRVHRHLRTLITLGYITQSPLTERYRVGSRLIALGRTASESADLASVAQSHMRKLRDTTGQAVSLAQIEDEGIRILNTISGTMQIEVGVRPGSLLGFANSAQGKVALSQMEPTQQDQIFGSGIKAATEYTITDLNSLRSHLVEVSKQGWATAPNETMLGLNALACPIFGVDGAIVATIAIVSLTQYIQTPPEKKQVIAVQEAASAISLALGHSATP